MRHALYPPGWPLGSSRSLLSSKSGSNLDLSFSESQKIIDSFACHVHRRPSVSCDAHGRFRNRLWGNFRGPDTLLSPPSKQRESNLDGQLRPRSKIQQPCRSKRNTMKTRMRTTSTSAVSRHPRSCQRTRRPRQQTPTPCRQSTRRQRTGMTGMSMSRPGLSSRNGRRRNAPISWRV